MHIIHFLKNVGFKCLFGVVVRDDSFNKAKLLAIPKDYLLEFKQFA